MRLKKGTSKSVHGGAAKSATKKKPTPSSGAAAKVAVKKTIAPRTTNSGIQKVVLVSFELGDFLGAPQVSRSEAVKKVWAYIKLQNLQVLFPFLHNVLSLFEIFAFSLGKLLILTCASGVEENFLLGPKVPSFSSSSSQSHLLSLNSMVCACDDPVLDICGEQMTTRLPRVFGDFVDMHAYRDVKMYFCLSFLSILYSVDWFRV
ncbi:hypothetical protein D0Y65_023920 [Glycine soja]|uniref:SWIB domain-containing protein n=1 Tax=Glycine soja TaxID=3848 RepID=A0A445J023_GLYSO|nr:hypothetical protein D0Y65_023920 [Glycine soja]